MEQKSLEEPKHIILSLIPTEPKGYHASDIAKDSGLRGRECRRIIQELRKEGHPICSSTKEGYWLARSSNELLAVESDLLSHIRSCIRTYSAINKTRVKMKDAEQETTH